MGEAKPCFSFIYFLILSFSTSLSLIHSYLTCSNMRLLLLLPFKDHFECCCLSLSSISCSCFYWFNLYFYCNDLPIPLSLSLSLSFTETFILFARWYFTSCCSLLLSSSILLAPIALSFSLYFSAFYKMFL